MTDETEKPVAKRGRPKKPERTVPQPWPYAQQMAFQDWAKRFVRAQQKGDAEGMQKAFDRLSEDMHFGMGK